MGKVECFRCGAVVDTNETIVRTVEVQVGRSGGSISVGGINTSSNTNSNGYSGGKRSSRTGKRNTQGTIWGYNTGRKYYRNTKVHVCKGCIQKEKETESKSTGITGKIIISVIAIVVLYAVIQEYSSKKNVAAESNDQHVNSIAQVHNQPLLNFSKYLADYESYIIMAINKPLSATDAEIMQIIEKIGSIKSIPVINKEKAKEAFQKYTAESSYWERQSYIDSALAYQPMESAYSVAAGKMRLLKNEYRESQNYFKLAIASNPNEPISWAYLALSYSGLNDETTFARSLRISKLLASRINSTAEVNSELNRFITDISVSEEVVKAIRGYSDSAAEPEVSGQKTIDVPGSLNAVVRSDADPATADLPITAGAEKAH